MSYVQIKAVNQEGQEYLLWVHYDLVGSGDLKESKKFHKNYVHVGSFKDVIDCCSFYKGGGGYIKRKGLKHYFAKLDKIDEEKTHHNCIAFLKKYNIPIIEGVRYVSNNLIRFGENDVALEDINYDIKNKLPKYLMIKHMKNVNYKACYGGNFVSFKSFVWDKIGGVLNYDISKMSNKFF